MRTRFFKLLLLAAAAAGIARPQIVPWAQRQRPRPDLLKKVGFDQDLNAQVPPDLVFRDEHGRSVPLHTYFGNRPIVLSLVYYKCPMLCTLALNGQLRAYRTLNFTIGRDFDVVVVSINPRETPSLAAAKKEVYLSEYRRPGAGTGWHFLTGTEQNIQALANAVGFHYAYDPESGQYAHTTGLIVLTPQGRIARYQFGVEYSPRDLEFSLIDASANKIGNPVQKFPLFCFHYDPATGKYSVTILRVLRIAAIATVLLVFGFIIFAARRYRNKPLRVPPGMTEREAAALAREAMRSGRAGRYGGTS